MDDAIPHPHTAALRRVGGVRDIEIPEGESEEHFFIQYNDGDEMHLTEEQLKFLEIGNAIDNRDRTEPEPAQEDVPEEKEDPQKKQDEEKEMKRMVAAIAASAVSGCGR